MEKEKLLEKEREREEGLVVNVFDRKVRVRCLQGLFLHNEMCVNFKNMHF